MHDTLVPASDGHRQLDLLLWAVMVIGISVAAWAGHSTHGTAQLTAAAIMESVFGTFFLGDGGGIRLLACGLGVAVLFDSTVMRGTLR